MAQALIFHYRDGDNPLVRLNPFSKLIALVSYTVIISSADEAVVFILSLIPLAVAFMIKLPWKEYIKESLFFIALAVMMALFRFAADHDALEALAPAAAFLSTVLFSMILTDTTMPDELSRSLGSALSHVIGKYAYSLSTVIEITLSMIPLIIDSALSMAEARRARGESFISHPLRSLCQLSVSILSDLLDKAEVYIDALYSRGYDASARRGAMPYRACDYVLIAMSIASLSIMAVEEVL